MRKVLPGMEVAAAANKVIPMQTLVLYTPAPKIVLGQTWLAPDMTAENFSNNLDFLPLPGFTQQLSRWSCNVPLQGEISKTSPEGSLDPLAEVLLESVRAGPTCRGEFPAGECFIPK